jgi:MFS family permease
MMLPSTLSLLNATFQGRERGIAFAVWGSTIGGMAAVGPLLGGWLTTSFSWRWASASTSRSASSSRSECCGRWASRAPRTRDRRDRRRPVCHPLGALVFGLIEGRTLGWWEERPFTIGGWSWPFSVSPVPVAFAMALLAAWAS